MSIPTLTPTYKQFFDELQSPRYRVFGVAEFFCDRDALPDPNHVNVILRIDVDNGLHLALPLARTLATLGLTASHFFLTHPDRYYRVWSSGVPRAVAELDQEVGVHSDHLFGKEVLGERGLPSLVEDIERLSQETDRRVRGVVYHGHPEMNRIVGRFNRELYADVQPKDLGIDYHEGPCSPYTHPGSLPYWEPRNCSHTLSDYMGFANSWGWNYFPSYPLRVLRRCRRGEAIHVVIHTLNAFEYWKGWTDEFGESMPARDYRMEFFRKAIVLRFRYLQQRFPRRTYWYELFLTVLARIIVKGLSPFSRPRHEHSVAGAGWDEYQRSIFERGIPYWRNKLVDDLGVQVAGKVVVEVGSGPGQWLIAASEDAERVIGVEPNELYREDSQRNVDRLVPGVSNIEIRDGSAEMTLLPDNCADVVLCLGVLMFTNHDTAIREMVRILRPGGELVVTANGLGYFWNYVVEGVRGRNPAPTRYGLQGLANSFLKTRFDKRAPGPRAVNEKVIRQAFDSVGVELVGVRLWLPEDIFPLERFGFTTNYAFFGRKRNSAGPPAI